MCRVRSNYCSFTYEELYDYKRPRGTRIYDTASFTAVYVRYKLQLILRWEFAVVTALLRENNFMIMIIRRSALEALRYIRPFTAEVDIRVLIETIVYTMLRTIQ